MPSNPAEFLTLSFAVCAHSVKGYCQNDERADESPLPEAAYAMQCQAVTDDFYQRRANDGTKYYTAAAHQVGTANHCRRDDAALQR